MADKTTLWLARLKNNSLRLYENKPIRNEEFGDFWSFDGNLNDNSMPLGVDSFPEVTYENSPVEISIIPPFSTTAMEDYKKKYTAALAMARECVTYVPDEAVKKYLESMFPELKEEEEDRTRNALIELVKQSSDILSKGNQTKMLEWIDSKKPFHWSEDDNTQAANALWCIDTLSKTVKDENGMGACWAAKKWVKSIIERLG